MGFIEIVKTIKKDRIWGESTKTGSIFIYFVIAFGIFIFFMSIFSIPFYKQFIREDGIVEYASAIFWFLAAISTVPMIIISKKRNLYSFLFYLLLCLFFIVCGGEEISWGQRIFNFKGPDLIVEANLQNECNLHDIYCISIFSNTFFLIYLFFFILYPYANFKYEKIHAFSEKYLLPVINYQTMKVAVISLIIWIVIGIRFGTLGFHPFSIFGYYTQMDDEIFEVLAAFSYLCFSINNVSLIKKQVPD